jgi:t-SNARE complex subunit (syntaxin)
VRFYFFLQALINILRIKVYKTMEALGVIWEVVKSLFRCANAQAVYVYKLQENLESLNKKWSDLQNKENDVLTEIDRDESTGLKKRTNEGIGWLQEFQKLQEVSF